MTIRTIINKFRGVTDVPSLVKKGLTIGENVFINFGCVIDENFCWLITIGDNVTLASNVHIPENSVVVGNPASIICLYDEYMEKQRVRLNQNEPFSYLPNKNEQKKIKKFLKENRIGFIE